MPDDILDDPRINASEDEKNLITFIDEEHALVRRYVGQDKPRINKSVFYTPNSIFEDSDNDPASPSEADWEE